ncbi:MAG TPA: hypothetical protein VKB84_15195 [Candidatus Binataceae bacterium]|nr:hypothetical protein [Candidatus Binataceae bacterium]
MALIVLSVASTLAAQQTRTAVRPLPHLTFQGRLAQGQALAEKLGINSAVAPDAPSIAAAQLERVTPAETPLGPWVSVGPEPIGAGQSIGPNGFCAPNPPILVSGRATALAFGAGGAIYLGTAGGGVWQSLDAGTTWAALTDTQPSLAVGALAVVPGATQAQDEIYVGTGESNQSGLSQYGQGILKSIDGGKTWIQLGLADFAFQTFARIAVVPGAGVAGADIVYAATTRGMIPGPTSVDFPPVVNAGVYKSLDGGNTWTILSGSGGLPPGGDANGSAADLALDPSTPTTIYAAIKCIEGCTYGGVWKSIDAGARWTHLTNGLPSISARMTLYVPTSSQLYAANTVDGNNFDAIYISSNFGASWTPGGTLPAVGGPDCLGTDQASYNIALGGDPATPNTIFLGLIGLYQSNDAGKTWRYTLDQSHSDFHDVVVNGGIIYAANDGGISLSTNGANWTQTINNGLATLQFIGNGLGPQNASTIIGGTQDNGSELYQNNPVWTLVNFGDGGLASISPAGGVYFAEAQLGALVRSNSGTAPSDFANIAPALDQTLGEQAPFYTAVVQDPSNADRLLFGTFRVWQSCAPGMVGCNATAGGPTDGSSATPVNWTPISAGLNPGCTAESEDGPQQGCLITDIRVAPSNPAIMYVVTAANGAIGPFAWVSQNSNTAAPTFANITRGLPAGQGRALSSVAISPVNPATVVVAVTGFTAGGGHIFESTNSGATWTDISPVVSGFPNIPTLKVMFDANDTTGNTIYAGTSDGILQTTNNGATWQNFSLDSLPLVQVFDLQQNPQTLLAGTHGRSAWTINTASVGAAVNVSPANASGIVGQTVEAGSIMVQNSTSTSAALRSVTISVSNPQLMSSMTLKAGSQSVTNSPVSTATTFNFQSPITIAANSGLTLDLSVVIAASQQTAMGSAWGRLAAALGRWPDSHNGESGMRPRAALTFVALAIGLALLTAGGVRRRYLTVFAASIFLMLAATQSGCGGSSSSTPLRLPNGTSNQSVTQVWVIQSPGSLAVTGVPVPIGEVARLE